MRSDVLLGSISRLSGLVEIVINTPSSATWFSTAYHALPPIDGPPLMRAVRQPLCARVRARAHAQAGLCSTVLSAELEARGKDGLLDRACVVGQTCWSNVLFQG